MVQQNVNEGKLLTPTAGESDAADYKIDMVELFKKGKIKEARTLLCGRARPEEMEEIYRWLYDNIEIFGTESLQEKAILIIKQGLVDHTICVDSEVNLAATLVKLARL
jgi:hypothetical protein